MDRVPQEQEDAQGARITAAWRRMDEGPQYRMPPPFPEQSLSDAFTLRTLEALVYRSPIETPVVTSFGTMRDRPMVLVRAEDADGVVGWGEARPALRSHTRRPAHSFRLGHDVDRAQGSR